MPTLPWTLLSVCAALGAAGCGWHAAPAKTTHKRVGQTRGAAVVLSQDERVMVATHRSTGSVTVCSLDARSSLTKKIDPALCHTLDTGPGSEPWAAVMGLDDDTAYVVLRRDQLLLRIRDLHGTPRIDPAPIALGAEPTALVIVPTGIRLFVANWGEGTISVVGTEPFRAEGKLDLNQALVDSGVLGSIPARAALAHPRALALTDDGDEDNADETLYATEFFSQRAEPSETVFDLDFDSNRQGLVYPIRLADKGRIGAPIALPALDTGFSDSTGKPTSCFPNQLYAAAAVGSRLFVSCMCTSPAGPVGPGANGDPANFKTLFHPALFMIDTGDNRPVSSPSALLTKALVTQYDADGVADDEHRRMPLIPNDLAFAQSEPDAPPEAWLTALGANAVYRLSFDQNWGLKEIGSEGQRFVDLTSNLPVGAPLGRQPIGIALSRVSTPPFALVLSDTNTSLAVVDRATQAVATGLSFPVKPDRPHFGGSDRVLEGRDKFSTGLGAWSFKGQAWASCESCHPDGLSDGITWFFPRGPRRTLSTAGTFDATGQQRLLLWTASVDEVHDVEAIVRNIAGGVGAMVWTYPSHEGDPQGNGDRIVYDGHAPAAGSTAKTSSVLRNNLNGSLAAMTATSRICLGPVCDVSAKSDWNSIEAYIRQVRAPRPVSPLPDANGSSDPNQVSRGATLFREGQCAGCHGGDGWTVSRRFYTPGEEANGTLPFLKPTQVTTEIGRLRLERYTVPAQYARLNPPAFVHPSDAGEEFSASLRRWEPAMKSAVDYAYDDPTTADADQMNCALRDVGTFPSQTPDPAQGISPKGGRPVREWRQDMKTLALGATGFNVPALVGLSTGAPYFHAGNAASLEQVFDPTFSRHHQALAPGFLAADDPDRDSKVRDLVAFLLGIADAPEDGAPAVVPVPPELDFCPRQGFR